jgi:hypothetical protein
MGAANESEQQVDPYAGQGGSYEVRDGKRVLVERTTGEGKRGTTDVNPSADADEIASLEADAGEAVQPVSGAADGAPLVRKRR